MLHSIMHHAVMPFSSQGAWGWIKGTIIKSLSGFNPSPHRYNKNVIQFFRPTKYTSITVHMMQKLELSRSSGYETHLLD